MIELPGFVDHHVHLVRVSAGARPPFDVSSPASIAAFHREVAARGSTPMDEPPEPDSGAEAENRIEAGLRWATEVGLVEITEAGLVDEAHWDALVRLREAGRLPLRVRILLASGLYDRAPHLLRRSGDAALDVIGVKFYADGWLGPGTCALCDPFRGTDADRGVLFMDATELARRVEPVAEADFLPATHAIGDRAIETVLDAYDAVYGADCPAAGPRIEHAQVVHADLVSRMAEMGVVACIQPSFAVSDAVAAVERLGDDRAAGSYRWDAMLAAGVRLIGGSDYPIEALAPLVGVQHLVTGRPVDGATTAPKAVTLPLPTVLDLVSDAAAGTTVLAGDLYATEPDAIHAIDVVGVRPAL